MAESKLVSSNVAELARVQRRHVNRPNSGEFGYEDPLWHYPPRLTSPTEALNGRAT